MKKIGWARILDKCPKSNSCEDNVCGYHTICTYQYQYDLPLSFVHQEDVTDVIFLVTLYLGLRLRQLIFQRKNVLDVQAFRVKCSFSVVIKDAIGGIKDNVCEIAEIGRIVSGFYGQFAWTPSEGSLSQYGVYGHQ